MAAKWRVGGAMPARETGTDACLHVHCGLTVGADYRALVCQTVGVP